jgi:hypothetical protein
MTIKVKIAVQSHLSDAAFEVDVNPYMAQRRIHFAKQLLAKYPDLNVEVEEDELDVMWYEMSFNAN